MFQWNSNVVQVQYFLFRLNPQDIKKLKNGIHPQIRAIRYLCIGRSVLPLCRCNPPLGGAVAKTPNLNEFNRFSNCLPSINCPIVMNSSPTRFLCHQLKAILIESMTEVKIHSDDDAEHIVDKYLSVAPLHLAWPYAHNCPTSVLRELLDEGNTIKRGRFSKRENRRLTKNWHRWCRLYPEFSDPFMAFGINDGRPENRELPPRDLNFLDESSSIARKKRRKFKKLNFMRRMAYKLDKRLICDIYFRCKKEIVNREYDYTSKRDIPEEKVEEALVDLQEYKKRIASVSSKHSISPAVVSHIKSKPTKYKRFPWKPEDDLNLEMAIGNLFPDSDPQTIPTYKIVWADVHKEMSNCGYELTKKQLYKRWIRLHKELVNIRHKSLFERRDMEVEQPIE